VENLTAKLYFHGHPINRREAREELHLKVMENPSLELEGAMWRLYKEYEAEFDNATIFNPLGELAAAHPLAASAPASPVAVPGGPPALPVIPSREDDLLIAIVESSRMSSRQTVKRRNTLLTMGSPTGPQRATLTEDLALRWESIQVQ